MHLRVNLINTEILSNNWYTLKKITYEFLKSDGNREVHTREAYDRGNGAGILLYNKNKKTVILTRQFRMPTYINGNEDGMLIEVCAGLLGPISMGGIWRSTASRIWVSNRLLRPQSVV